MYANLTGNNLYSKDMKRKTIIAVWGAESQGKSDTIKRTAHRILWNYPTTIVENVPIDYSGDVTMKLFIPEINLKIGIESQGDPNSIMFTTLPQFASEGRELIICATRTRQGTVDLIGEISGTYGYDVIWISNYMSYEKDHAALNNLSADQIFETAQLLINSRL